MLVRFGPSTDEVEPGRDEESGETALCRQEAASEHDAVVARDEERSEPDPAFRASAPVAGRDYRTPRERLSNGAERDAACQRQALGLATASLRGVGEAERSERFPPETARAFPQRNSATETVVTITK